MSVIAVYREGMELRLYLLGRFEARAGDKIVVNRSWSRRKAAALLKLLVLHPSHALHREQVMDVLWPDLDPSAAANNLHKNLHYLRTTFAPFAEQTAQTARVGQASQTRGGGNGAPRPVVGLTAELVTLSPDVWIDCDAFRSRARAARAAREPSLYEEALALYTGPVLPEDIYEDWTGPVRDELQALWIDLLTEVAHLYEARGQADLAVERWRQVLDADPLQEPAHRALMRLYAQTGSRHRALRQYQQCRDVLQRELGVEPSPDTEVLGRQLLAGVLPLASTASMASTAAEVSSAPPGQSGSSPALNGSVLACAAEPTPSDQRPRHEPLPPFFGRERELELAEDVLDAVRGGRGQVLLVGGVAGIGKSRFAQQVLAAAEEQGALTLTGRSYELEATASYQPVRDMLRQLLAGHADLLSHSSHVWRLLPTGQALGSSGAEPAPVADPMVLQAELFDETAGIFGSLATTSRPLVLFFDDLHAADDASLRLVHVLCRRLAQHPVLIVATCRAEVCDQSPALAALLGSLRRERLCREVSLGPLPERAMYLVVEQLFEGRPVARDLLQDIVRRAEGNPLFAGELVHTAIEQGWVRFAGGRWQRRRGAASLVPGVVHDLLDHRLQRLGDVARQVLHLAAAAGHDVDYGLLRRAFLVPEGDLLDALDDCLGAFVLEETPRGYRYRHSLLREAIYSRLSRARRQQLHRTLAHVLAEDEPMLTGEESAEAIGYHFAQSDEPWRAVPFLQHAARRAAAVFANEQAIRLYEQAVAILRDHPARGEPSLLASLVEALGDLKQRAGEVSRAAAHFEEACGLLAAGEQAEVVRVRGKAALAHIATGNVARADELLQATLQAITEQSPHLVVSRTYYILAQLHWHSAQYREALQAAEKAFLAAEASGDAVQRAHAYEVLALACHSLGDWQRGVECELNRHKLGVEGFDTDEAFDAHL